MVCKWLAMGLVWHFASSAIFIDTVDKETKEASGSIVWER